LAHFVSEIDKLANLGMLTCSNPSSAAFIPLSGISPRTGRAPSRLIQCPPKRGKVRPRNGFERKHAKFPRKRRIPFGRRFDPLARVTGDARAFRHGFNQKIVLVSSAEAEKIAGKQKLDNLTSAIGPSDALSRSAGDHAEPIYSWTCFAADFLIAPLSLDRCETIDALQVVGWVRRDLDSIRGVVDSDMGSSSDRNEWFKFLVRRVSFLFVSGYPPPTGLDHQAYQEEAALLVPIAHRSKLTESRLPPFSQP
jgi:hypothetical protein